VYCTGRREEVREATEEWLIKHGLDVEHLIMRPNKDHRHDTEVKPEQLIKHVLLEDIAFVLEDRDSMVALWRRIGLRCLQVNYGNF
jgi:hypothetical protein